MSKSIIKHSNSMIGKSIRSYLGYHSGQKSSFLKPLNMKFSTKEVKKESLVQISHIEGTKVTNLILNRPPINSLNLSLNKAISSAIKEVESQHPNTQAIILKSSNPNIFSAGLDLLELYQPNNPDRERLATFWRSFQQVFIDLYSTRLSTIAAIQGHAPAGGCMLAMACDYRIMGGSPIDGKSAGTIGLNETKLGIAAPYWLADLMVNTIGLRQAEISLGLGLLYTPEKALDIGLVDHVVDSENVFDAALKEANKWSEVPPVARYASKMWTRRDELKKLEERREDDINTFCDFILNDDVQKHLGHYLQNLKRKN